MKQKSFVTIMAGGIGSRFWPLSRNKKPKQFLDLLGVGKSLLQMTYERFSELFSEDEIFIVTSDNYVELVLQQIPNISRKQIISEPQRKNTAPCIAYAAFKLQNLHPDSNMVVSPADHLILEKDDFLMNVQEGISFIENNDALLTLGIKPTKPHTGYGYIQFEEKKNERFKMVKTFTEKPNLGFAKQFISSGEFLWNSGIFIWNTKKILSSFQQYLPDVYEALADVNYGTDTEETEIQNAYSLCPNISIDYGILEKEKNIFVLPTYFTWSDLGTWEALYDINTKNQESNTANTKNIRFNNVKSTIVHELNEDKLVVLQDVENLIVVDTDDVLLVCNKNSEQKLKEIVNLLSAKNFDEYL